MVSTPCAKYTTIQEVTQIRDSVQEKIQRDREIREKYGNATVLSNGMGVQIGDVSYTAAVDRNYIQDRIHERIQSAKLQDKQLRQVRSEMTPEDRANKKRQDGLGIALQGRIGERIGTELVSKAFNWEHTGFTQSPQGNGFDGLYKDASGKLFVVEYKNTHDSRSGIGSASLANTVTSGKEMSNQWIQAKAEMMCDRASTLYTPQNAILGKEILQRGVENVEKVLVYTSPDDLSITVSMGNSQNTWQPFLMLEPDWASLASDGL